VNRRAPLDEGLGEHFSRREALHTGATIKRLSARDLRIEFRGARSREREYPPISDGFEQRHAELMRRCAAFQPVAPERFAFSHTTAAQIYRLPLPKRLTDVTDIHVSVPPGVRTPRRRGIVGHLIAAPDRRTADGLPVVDPVVAWLQVAPELTVDELVVVGDALVRRKRPLTTLLALRELIDESAGARGIRNARTAFENVRSGTDSPPESEVRLTIVRAGLQEPLVRYTVYDADGFFVGTPDLAYVKERIAIEYQGAHHWQDREVFEEDIVRRELFRRAGWHVFLVTSRSLRNPANVVAELRGLLEERAAL